jgi:photosystem II stability/assembly factor-like uncharacterized protein
MFKYSYLLLLLFLLLSFQHECHAQQWTKIPITFSTGDTFNYNTWEAAFVTKNIGWFASQSGKIFKTTDGGLNWQLKKQMSGMLMCLFALDSLNMWLRYKYHWVVSTHDGGVHWDSVAFNPEHSPTGKAIYFFNANEGLSFGYYLYHTTDGGKIWKVINYKDSAMFYNTWYVDFIDQRYGWIGGSHPFATDAGFISITNDSGRSWNFAYPGRAPCINNLVPIDTLIGFSAGYFPFEGGGVVYSTTNGGNAWTTQFLYGTDWLWDIKMLNSQKGWTSGENGTLWQTTDGGTHWVLQTTNVDVDLLKISVIPQDSIVYVFGTKNTLLRNDVTDAVVEKENIPSSFNLLQNYPNPFNPVTTIEYTIPHREHIVLDVYNLSGNKVKTLYDGIREVGVYPVSFDASSSPTGIYFIRLQSSNSVIIRKVLLIK